MRARERERGGGGPDKDRTLFHNTFVFFSFAGAVTIFS